MQSYNRYSYVLNNPLVHTDPSGYWGRKQQGYLREAAAIAIAVYTGVYYAPVAATGVTATGVAASTTQAAVASIAAGYASGFTSSGNLSGAALGALSAGINLGIGQYVTNEALNVAAHATAGGVLEVLNGGKFGHGFISAGISASVNPHIDRGNDFTNGVAASIVGGTTSAITGGKFANGALSAAFEYSFSNLIRLASTESKSGTTDSSGEINSGNSQLTAKLEDDVAFDNMNKRLIDKAVYAVSNFLSSHDLLGYEFLSNIEGGIYNPMFRIEYMAFNGISACARACSPGALGGPGDIIVTGAGSRNYW